MAVRLGFYTGKLYGSDVDKSTIKECCLLLNYKEPIKEDGPYVETRRKEAKKYCEGCYGCPESQKDKHKLPQKD